MQARDGIAGMRIRRGMRPPDLVELLLLAAAILGGVLVARLMRR